MTPIEPEETVERRVVFDGARIQVRREIVRVAGGTTTRELVIHPEVVAVLPVLNDGHVILVRQYRKAAEQILLEIPAGGLEPGENAADAVRREMIEETGYRVGTMEPMCSFYTSPGFTNELMHLYLARDLEAGEPTEDTDQIEVTFQSLSDARVAVQSGQIRDAKTILALALYSPHGQAGSGAGALGAWRGR